MVITRTREELYKTLEEFSKRPGKLALIPTMGNLHDGHLSLIKLAKLKASKTITTIFINPLQFGKNEDFKKYPRTEKSDIEKLKKEHCDILFIPPLILFGAPKKSHFITSYPFFSIMLVNDLPE